MRGEIDYKKPLTSGDHFYVGLNFSMVDRVRFAFEQSIHRFEDELLCVQERIIGTAMNARGRPMVPRELAEQLS